MCKQKAFTLIELLVVVSIIGLLMAILMPALNRARKQAKSTACMTNLHQWSSVFLMYTDQNNSYFGEGWYEEGKEHQWMHTLRPYYKNPDLSLCPAATKPLWDISSGGGVDWGPGVSNAAVAAWGRFPEEGIWPEFIDGYENAIGSYALNEWVSNPPDDGAWGGMIESFWRTTNVRGADNIPLFLDCWWMGGFPLDDNDPAPYDGMVGAGAWGEEMRRYCINRHNLLINGLFVNLSVRKLGLKQLWQLKWHRAFNNKNNDWVETTDYIPDWPDWMKNAKNYD